MKKILFLGSILFGTLVFAGNGNSRNSVKNDAKNLLSETISGGTSAEPKIITNTNKPLVKPRGMVTIEFDINCGGTVGHMTVSYMSDNDGSLGALIEVANAINQGTIQGCQQMASHGLL